MSALIVSFTPTLSPADRRADRTNPDDFPVGGPLLTPLPLRLVQQDRGDDHGHSRPDRVHDGGGLGRGVL